MSSWTIYNIQGTPKYTVKDVEYHDTWMGEEYVMVKITSPTPLDLSIGDYLVYRGLTYSVYSVPGALKQARRNTYGEAFVYENIKLSARGTELTDIRFLDYVLNDNNIHYTSLPTFAFYAETVDDLLDRLQANTDREGVQWMFISPSYNRTMQRYEQGTAAYQEAAQLWEQYFGGSHEDPVYEKTNVNISIDKQSVWDGLAPIKNDFGLNFFSRERAVIVGGEGMPAEHIFRYGKGNGLYQIERVADQDQKVTTKLYAYGSDKNLPIRYYANITRICFAYLYARPSVDSNILYLDFVWNRSYVTGAADSEGEFPVVVSISGVTYNVKAYPMEVGARTLFTIEASVSLGFVTRSMEIDFVSGIDKDKFPASNIRQESGALPNNMAVQVLMLPGFPQYSLADLCRCTYNGEQTVLEIRKTPSESYNEFMRIDGNHPVTFSNDPLQPYILSGNIDTIGIKEGDVHFVEDNDDNGLKEIYPSIEGMTRGDVEGTSSTERLDEIVSCEVIQDNGVFGEGVTIQNFNLMLKDIGFNLKEAFDNAGQNMIISMKDGYCGGRDFTVHNVTANANGTWTLNVERSHDEGLDLWFPYSTNAAIGQTPTADEPYQIRTGDHFVLTEIEIGDTSYIWAAAMKMLRKSITYLLNNDYTRFTYLPKVDEIYMARQHDESQTQAGIESLHDTLKSGMLMLFEDEDLDVDGSVFIDSLTIKENGNNGIPTYDVVLRNDKQVGTMQRIQNQINSLTSYIGSGGSGGSGGGGLSVSQIRSLINTYGGELFLSKVNADIAAGRITFQQGIESLMLSVFNGIRNNGRVTSDEADIPLFVSDTTIQGNINASGDANIGRQVDSRNVKTDVVQSHNYTGEGFADTGYRLTSDDGTGSSALTVDNLHVRKKATFEELEVKKETAIAGNQVYSCAANVITRTDYYNGSGDVIGYSKIRSPWLLKGLALVLGKRAANFKLFGRYKTVRVYLPDASQINYVRCYFLAKDGDREVENMWQAGKKDGVRWHNHGNDLARCQTMNLKNSNRKTYISSVGEYKLGNVYWWRKVINVSSQPVTIDGQEYHYFDVSMGDCDAGSDIPAAGDHVVQFGNDSDPDRMNIIVLEVNGGDAPAEKFYEGIHNYNLNDCYYGGHTIKTRLSPKAGYKFQGSKFEIVTEYAVSPVPIERGEWVEGTTYYYYDIVQHNGATWLCVASTGNVYTVVEDIKDDYTVIYPKGTTLNQTKYNALTVSQKMLCTRTSTGSTTLEPTEANSSVWRYYAQQGTSPYFADIDNEMDSVVCDKDGKTTAAYSTTFRVYLWHGSTEMTLSDITISGTTTDITATKNVTNKTVTVSVAKGKTIPLATELTITPKATGAPNDQSVHFVLNGVRPGADGKPAVLYSIIPSISSIKCDKSNTLTPTSFTCTVQKVSGDSVSTATSTDGTLRYSIDNDITTSTQGTALTIGGTINSYTSSNKYIVLAFFEGTTLRDKERILIVADGSDGNGIVSIATTYARSSQSSTASETTAPTIDGSWSSTMPTLTDTYKYLWRREITTYTDTSKNTTKYFLAAVKGQEGVNGKDGWMVTADPANVIITQSLGTNTTSFSTQAVTFSAKKGNVSATITSIGTPTWTNFTGSKSGTTVTVTSPTRDGSNNYYTEGKFVVSVNVTDPDSGSTVTFYITVPCYANLLGTWKESVENGVKTVVAEEVDYDYLDGVLTKNGRTYTQTATAAGNYETWSTQADTVNGSKANMIKKTTTAQQTADGVSTKVSAITSEVSGQTVLKESQVTQYADKITASVTDGLTNTGIDIEHGLINLQADKVVISNDLVVPTVISENDDMRTTIQAGKLKIESKKSTSYGIFEINSLNEIVLQMFDKDGKCVINLGGTPNALVSGKWENMEMRMLTSTELQNPSIENLTANAVSSSFKPCTMYYRLVLGKLMNSDNVLEYFLPDGTKTEDTGIINLDGRVFTAKSNLPNVIKQLGKISGHFVNRNDGMFRATKREEREGDIQYEEDVYYYASGKVNVILKKTFSN